MCAHMLSKKTTCTQNDSKINPNRVSKLLPNGVYNAITKSYTKYLLKCFYEKADVLESLIKK